MKNTNQTVIFYPKGMNEREAESFADDTLTISASRPIGICYDNDVLQWPSVMCGSISELCNGDNTECTVFFRKLYDTFAYNHMPSRIILLYNNLDEATPIAQMILTMIGYKMYVRMNPSTNEIEITSPLFTVKSIDQSIHRSFTKKMNELRRGDCDKFDIAKNIAKKEGECDGEQSS